MSPGSQSVSAEFGRRRTISWICQPVVYYDVAYLQSLSRSELSQLTVLLPRGRHGGQKVMAMTTDGNYDSTARYKPPMAAMSRNDSPEPTCAQRAFPDFYFHNTSLTPFTLLLGVKPGRCHLDAAKLQNMQRPLEEPNWIFSTAAGTQQLQQSRCPSEEQMVSHTYIPPRRIDSAVGNVCLQEWHCQQAALMVGHLPATPCAPADARRKQPYILPIGALRCRWEARSPFPAPENLQRGREAAAQAKLQKRLFLEANVQPHSLPPPSAPADAHQKRPNSFPIGARQSHWVARSPFLAPEYLPVAAKPN